MQQFLFFCTMLIVTSQAFFQELHGRKISANFRRNTPRFAPKLRYFNPNMFGDLNIPMFIEPSAQESSNYETPFFVPLRRHGLKSKRGKNHSLQKNRRFSSRKRLRRKLIKKRGPQPPFHESDSFIFNAPQCFQSDWPLSPNENFVNYFGDSQSDALIRNPNQYVVCFYPVFNHLKRKTFSRFPSLKRQYMTDLENSVKNKRSANDSSPKNESANRKVAVNENHLENLDLYKPSFHQSVDEAVPEKTPGSRNSREKLDALDSSLELPFDFGLSSYQNLENPWQNSLLPPASDSLNDYYDSSSDMTPLPLKIPKFTFKYPYDPKLYESSLRKDRNFPAKSMKKETESAAEENVALGSFPRDLGKLKLMLEEVESVLKSKVTGKDDGEDKKKKNEKEKEKNKKKEKEENGEKEKKHEKPEAMENHNETITLKEKIDTIAIPILSQISRELERVANESSPSQGANSNKSKMRCVTDGTWTSTGLGFDLTFTTMPNMMLSVKVTAKSDSIINKQWSIHGLTLSKRGGPLMLAAIYPQRRKIASFIGQCKICRDQDLIFGAWTIYTCARRYTDLWKAVETKLDILKNLLKGYNFNQLECTPDWREVGSHRLRSLTATTWRTFEDKGVKCDTHKSQSSEDSQ